MGSSEDDDDKEEEERGSGDERAAAEVKRGRWCGGGGGGGDGEVGGRHGGGGGATVRRQGPPPGHLFLLIFLLFSLFSLLCVFHHFLFLCYTTPSNMKTDEGRRTPPEIHRLFYHLPWNNLNGCFLSYTVLTSIKIQIHIQTSHHERLAVNGTLPNTERIISHK